MVLRPQAPAAAFGRQSEKRPRPRQKKKTEKRTETEGRERKQPLKLQQRQQSSAERKTPPADFGHHFVAYDDSGGCGGRNSDFKTGGLPAAAVTAAHDEHNRVKRRCTRTEGIEQRFIATYTQLRKPKME